MSYLNIYIKNKSICIILGGLVIFMLSMLTTGCSNQTENDMPKEAILAMDLLENKYGETFEVKKVGERWGTLVKDTFKAIVAPTNDPTLVFEATVDKDGSYIIDGYKTEVATRDIENVLNEDVKEVISEAFVMVDTGSKVFENDDLEIDAKEFIELYPNSFYGIYLHIPEEEYRLENIEVIMTCIKILNNSLDLKEGNLFIVPFSDTQKQLIMDYRLEHVYHDAHFDSIVPDSKVLIVRLKEGHFLDLEIDLEAFLKQ